MRVGSGRAVTKKMNEPPPQLRSAQGRQKEARQLSGVRRDPTDTAGRRVPKRGRVSGATLRCPHPQPNYRGCSPLPRRRPARPRLRTPSRGHLPARMALPGCVSLALPAGAAAARLRGAAGTSMAAEVRGCYAARGHRRISGRNGGAAPTERRPRWRHILMLCCGAGADPPPQGRCSLGVVVAPVRFSPPPPPLNYARSVRRAEGDVCRAAVSHAAGVAFVPLKQSNKLLSANRTPRSSLQSGLAVKYPCKSINEVFLTLHCV